MTMYFLTHRGPDVALRYLLHHEARAFAAAEQYQLHAQALGHEPLDPTELVSLQERRDALVTRFGPGYASPYGWAATALANPNPKFTQIEQAVDMDKWRPFFRLASEGTHASSHGLAYSLGMLHSSDVLLAGASNAGLADPGASTAISLAQATVAFLGCRPTFRDLPAMLTVLRLAEHVESAFTVASRELDEEEQRERAAGRGGGALGWT